MQKKLQELKKRSGGSEASFLPFIAASGHHLKALPAGSIDSLRYRNKVLEIDVNASSIESIESLQRVIQKEALKVELKAITTDGGKVRGRLVVSEEKSA